MSLTNQLLHNKVLMNAMIAWICAQTIKAVIYTAINKKFELSRLFGDGGMPSGHSATVASAAVTSAIYYGLSSFQFAFTAILAIIVMHDAMGVRQETGKQAKLLNKLINSMGDALASEENLKELIGHTPTQVFVGCALGVILAFILS